MEGFYQPPELPHAGPDARHGAYDANKRRSTTPRLRCPRDPPLPHPPSSTTPICHNTVCPAVSSGLPAAGSHHDGGRAI